LTAYPDVIVVVDVLYKLPDTYSATSTPTLTPTATLSPTPTPEIVTPIGVARGTRFKAASSLSDPIATTYEGAFSPTIGTHTIEGKWLWESSLFFNNGNSAIMQVGMAMEFPDGFVPTLAEWSTTTSHTLSFGNTNSGW